MEIPLQILKLMRLSNNLFGRNWPGAKHLSTTLFEMGFVPYGQMKYGIGWRHSNREAERTNEKIKELRQQLAKDVREYLKTRKLNEKAHRVSLKDIPDDSINNEYLRVRGVKAARLFIKGIDPFGDVTTPIEPIEIKELLHGT